jgi:hypothetical protein
VLAERKRAVTNPQPLPSPVSYPAIMLVARAFRAIRRARVLDRLGVRTHGFTETARSHRPSLARGVQKFLLSPHISKPGTTRGERTFGRPLERESK